MNDMCEFTSERKAILSVAEWKNLSRYERPGSATPITILRSLETCRVRGIANRYLVQLRGGLIDCVKSWYVISDPLGVDTTARFSRLLLAKFDNHSAANSALRY